MTASAAALLAWALTGEDLPVVDVMTTSQFLESLEEVGWPTTRIESHARQTWAEGLPWPHPLPAGSLDNIGAAQWYAILGEVRHTLGLSVIHLPPGPPRPLTPDERRLLDEVPPHHGPIG